VIPEELKPGLQVYRKIRNKLHHEDGAPLDDSGDLEIHLMQSVMPSGVTSWFV